MLGSTTTCSAVCDSFHTLARYQSGGNNGEQRRTLSRPERPASRTRGSLGSRSNVAFARAMAGACVARTCMKDAWSSNCRASDAGSSITSRHARRNGTVSGRLRYTVTPVLMPQPERATSRRACAPVPQQRAW